MTRLPPKRRSLELGHVLLFKRLATSVTDVIRLATSVTYVTNNVFVNVKLHAKIGKCNITHNDKCCICDIKII